MTLRARIAKRIRFVAAMEQVIAFLETHPGAAIGETMEDTFTIGPGTFEERKAEADRIAATWEATTIWRNGYYMAERRFGSLVQELHFAQVIMRPDGGGDADAVYPQAT